LGILSFVFKTDFFSLANAVGVMPGGDAAAPARDDPSRKAKEEPMVQFIDAQVKDMQDFWTQEFAKSGKQYPRAKLVLYWDGTDTACGFGESAAGPFYCPGDQNVYLDLAFYDELKQRFRAPGDFAQAYVIAHEIGHHIQQVMGVEQKVRALQQRNPGARNQLSVRMELQADCLAGVWGNSAIQRDKLDPGDLEEGLTAASAIGDDAIQKMSGGRVRPESFTHGSSQDRVMWLRRGVEGGKVAACDTFAAQ
jgi:predicted metalloprotease